MLRALSRCLLLLLMLTLPLQGVSAALFAVQMQRSDHAGSSAGMPDETCHHAHAMRASDAHGSSAASQDAHHMPGKLKTCAGCCGSLAAGFEFSRQLPAHPGQSYLAADLPTPEGVIPGGPERPPRHPS